ncbi:unnamed protein product, partial [marine sediment metagenome]
WDPDGGRANYGGNWSRAEWWNIDPGDLTIEWVQGDLWEKWSEMAQPPYGTLQESYYVEDGQIHWGYFGDYRWYSGYGGGVFINRGSNVTFIDCQGTRYDPHRAFYFRNGEGPNSKVLGFTIINGYAQGPAGAPGQPGYNGDNLGYNLSDFDPVSVDPAADPNTLPPRALNGANATGNGYGGAILCGDPCIPSAWGSPTIQYCVIENCTVTGAQGGDGAVGQNGPWQHWTLGDEDPCFPGQIDPDATMTDNDDGQWGGHGGAGSGNGYGGAIACLGGSSP